MWQRFTERARKVVFYSQEEAQAFGEGGVSTEHLLLGLTREPDSVAARVLERLGVRVDRVRAEVERQLPPREAKPAREMTLTPRAKRVIDLAYDEARTLNNNYIGTEHLLLGLIREGDGLAGRVLHKLGAGLDAARRAVNEMQENEPPRKPDTARDVKESRLLADRDRSALIVIDVQDAVLNAIESKARVIGRCKFLIEIARLLNVPIVVTEQNARRLGGTNAEILESLGKEQKRHDKMRFSSCGLETFREEWKGSERDQAIIVGIETHICVNQTAHDFLAFGAEVFVCADAVGSRLPDAHDISLTRMMEAGAIIAHTESVAYEWLKEAGTDEFRKALEIVKRYA
ncbi:MAG: isochorismatase family protein [Armatimonadetes bacterium]|nr:isochorismatase family protein [Armatimonadota bacterium]